MLLSKRGFEGLFCRAETSSVEKRHWKSKGKLLDARKVVLLGERAWASHAGEVLALMASGLLSHLWEAAKLHCRRFFFSKNEPHSLQNPPPSANSIPAGTWPPAASALTTPSPPIPGKIPSQHRNYRLSWEKKHMRHSDYIEMLLPVSVTLKKWMSPKEWDLWPRSYQECSLQCRRCTTLKYMKPHKGLTWKVKGLT